MPLLTGEKEGGGVETVKVDEEGKIKVDLGVAPVVGPPLGSEEALPVAIIGEPTVFTIPDPSTTFAGAVPGGTAAPAVRVAGEVETSDTLAQQQLGQIRTNTQEIEDRLPQDGGRLAVETELAATGNLATEAKQDQEIAATAAVEAELQDKATEATAQAIEDDVDGLEAGQATGNASLASLDTKTPLGPAAASGSRPVVLATDHGGLPAGTSTLGGIIPRAEQLTPAEGQASVTTIVQLSTISASTSKRGWLVTNAGPDTARVGGPGITSSLGTPLVKDASMRIPTSTLAGWYVVSTGTSAIHVLGGT